MNYIQKATQISPIIDEFLAFFGLATIGLAERLAVKRKSPHLIEDFKTWCVLLCAYRTNFLVEKRELIANIDGLLSRH